MIKFACPHCQQHFTTDESDCGNETQYPVCQKTFVIPHMAAQAVESPAAYPPPAQGRGAGGMAAAASNVQRVKPLVIAAWVMIGITCLVSLIPGLGFATWLVAAPILFITLVAGIIVMTKGALCMGF